MSNFDLLEWYQYLKIPIKNFLSRDGNVPHNHKLALFIYNLEPSYMNGSHWVATYVKDNVINYFDSFGMQPFQELVDHAKRKNLPLLHQNQQIQNLYTTTCGYFCLYFLNEMHKGKGDYFDLLQCQCVECGITKFRFLSKNEIQGSGFDELIVKGLASGAKGLFNLGRRGASEAIKSETAKKKFKEIGQKYFDQVIDSVTDDVSKRIAGKGKKR